MTAFTVPGSREPVTYVDPSGKMVFSRTWFLFFQQLFERVGGASGPSLPDIAESLDDGDSDTQLSSAVYALTDEVRARAEVNGLREEVAELRKLVEGIQQGTAL